MATLLQGISDLCRQEQTYNLIFLASCEEENSGKDGIESILPALPPISFSYCRRNQPEMVSGYSRERLDGNWM